MFECDQVSLAIPQSHHLSESRKWRIIDRIKGGQTQISHNIWISLKESSGSWREFLSTRSIDRQTGKWRPGDTTTSENRLSLLILRNHGASTRNLVSDL